MANTEYLLPNGTVYNDTEKGAEILIPDGTVINEQAAAGGQSIVPLLADRMGGSCNPMRGL